MAETANNVAVKEPTLAFGKKEQKLITDPFIDNNPISVQVLGICSALAVTTQVKPALIMGIAVVLVCAIANLTISVLRKGMPQSVRMIVQLVVIATLVTVVELVLKALDYGTYKMLSVFIGLIITNCIIMGRLEAFAMANKPWQSFLDGVGNGLGYGFILVMVAVIREFFGKGSLMGYQLIGPQEGALLQISADSAYMNNNLMVLPASALFIIGVMIWVMRKRRPHLVDIS